jgi:hypothetical protein
MGKQIYKCKCQFARPWTEARGNLGTWFSINCLIGKLQEQLQEFALQKWHQNKSVSLFVIANIKGREMMRGDYIEDSGVPRQTGEKKSCSAGDRKRVRDNVCFICKQPGN